MHNEREIDALLSGGEVGSIIDRLMSMPQRKDGTQRVTEWDRAVSSRMEMQLVRQMRLMIEGNSENQRSAA